MKKETRKLLEALEQRVVDLECNLSHHTHSVSPGGFTGRPWFSPLEDTDL